MTTWLITGANGNLGRRLIQTLLADAEQRVQAVVRSARAAAALDNLDLAREQRHRLDVEIVSYTDQASLTAAAQSCDVAVHLVGILKESAGSSYTDAHEASCQALAGACRDAGVGHIVYLSIVGSTPHSANACLASKGRAETLLRDCGVGASILRVPMVLGEGDFASRALYFRALKSLSVAFRAGSLEQPIYAGDVVRAILQAARLRLHDSVDLGGPQVVSRREVTERMAGLLGRRTRVLSLPVALGYAIAFLLERVSANPPITRAMLGVLDHDDNVDSSKALRALELTGLTSLDDTLRAVLVHEASG